MLSAAQEITSRLQPPGAGLPRLELLIVRLLVGWQARRATRQSAAALFTRERNVISGLVRNGDAEMDGQRVLIKRLIGLEDSSRYWSVYMTLDHLRIIHLGIGGLIRLLGRGEMPAQVVGTADVKPTPGVGAEVIGEFERACDFFADRVAAVDDLRATPRWPHPWFGPLNAADWHFVTAFHLGLHRRQIEAIRAAQQQTA